MGTGTKIGIILVLILVVVVIANLLDSEVQRGPSVEQQVTGTKSSSVTPVSPPSVRPAVIEQRDKNRPVQARSLVDGGATRRGASGTASDSNKVVNVSDAAVEGGAAIRPAVGRVSEAGVSRATGVIRSGGEISSPTGSSARVNPPVSVRPVKPVTVIDKPAKPQLNTITVQPNDSLWVIATRHLGSGLRWSELLEVNPGLTEKTTLQPGQVLKIPTKTVVAKRPVAPVTASVGVPSGFRSVVIREGDTLYDLADQHMGSHSRWSEIKNANPGLDPGRLPVGRKILIPR
ncbi:MAG: LysM peptidoglycan-binding domain-containing protein [Planctomycetota bacterium]|nr:LysM peptidoglycan-binding domain-containing protein [Planctomycetota bacterium]